MKIFSNKEKRLHYSLEPIESIDATYNLIYGEKSNGKSYGVKEKCLRAFLENGEQMVLVRRYDVEIKRIQLDSYFSDMPIDRISNGEYNELYCYGSELFMALNVNGKRQNAKKFGYALALNKAQSYSGTEYPKVTRIVLEEFVSLDGRYLSNELFLFNHIVSTVARRRNVKCYLLANTLSRITPYWREFGVDEIIKSQEQGTICVIKRETVDGLIQKVAVEYCANTEGRSLMFAGSRAAMINEGKWLVVEKPKLPKPLEEWHECYYFVLEYKKDKFALRYLVDDFSNECIYVTPKTTDIKPNTRVISDQPSVDPLYTFGFSPLSISENRIFKLITQNKVFYCDSLTGTEFETCLKNLKRIYT